MSDYRRMVSYIYSYDEGVKNKNVGFARIESRNGQCKILVNLKGANTLNGNEHQVYFFRKEEDKLVGIHLGNFLVRNGTGEFREITNTDNIKNSGYGLSSVGGVLIRSAGNSKKVFASGWDDGLLKVDNFIPENEHVEVMKEETSQGDYIEEVEIEDKKLEVEEVETEKVIDKEIINEEIIDEKVIDEELVREEGQEPHLVAAEERAKSSWEQLCDSYTKVQAFEGEPEITCLKINLKDIERLPKKNWSLVNNSFLLHGYYSYRYLILANLEPSQSKSYIIGIPGIFHPNEKFVAAMFGFEYFRPAKKSNALTGQFGYWYTNVKEN